MMIYKRLLLTLAIILGLTMILGCKKGDGDLLVVYQANVSFIDHDESGFIELLKKIAEDHEYQIHKRVYSNPGSYDIINIELTNNNASALFSNLEQRSAFFLAIRQRGSGEVISHDTQKLIKLIEGELTKNVNLIYKKQELETYDLNKY